MSGVLPTECCPKCYSPCARVGFSPRALRQTVPSRDVLACSNCAYAFTFTKSGKPRQIREYVASFDPPGSGHLAALEERPT